MEHTETIIALLREQQVLRRQYIDTPTPAIVHRLEEIMAALKELNK